MEICSVEECQRRTAPRGAGLEWLKKISSEEPDGLCRLWPFPRKGRPSLNVNGKRFLAYHVSLELSGRIRPESPNDNALHSCDNPSCCAPWHLRWGTHGENVEDKLSRGWSKLEKLIAWLDEHSIEFPEEMR